MKGGGLVGGTKRFCPLKGGMRNIYPALRGGGGRGGQGPSLPIIDDQSLMLTVPHGQVGGSWSGGGGWGG